MYMQPDIAPLPNIAAVKVEDPKEGNFLLLISLSLSLSLSLFLSLCLCLSLSLHLISLCCPLYFPLQLKLVEYHLVAPYE